MFAETARAHRSLPARHLQYRRSVIRLALVASIVASGSLASCKREPLELTAALPAEPASNIFARDYIGPNACCECHR
jgi:hypothetical protein